MAGLELGQNRAKLKTKLRSALANKSVADALLNALVLSQTQLNSALDKLNADAASSTPAVAATATLAVTTPIVLHSVATGSARNTNTFTLHVLAAAANPGATVLASFTGTSAAISLTITPNDGTNNTATPVNLTTAQVRELITTGAVSGKSVTVTDTSSLRALQTATGGGAANVVHSGEGDGVIATFSGGANAIGGLDTNYSASLVISPVFQADEAKLPGQYKATLRSALRSALAHRFLADEISDAMEEFQVAYNALLSKLDAQAGTLASTNFVSTLYILPIDEDVIPEHQVQHEASFRKSLRSALANAHLADQILDSLAGIQKSYNSALVLLDAHTITGLMSPLKVVVLDPESIN